MEDKSFQENLIEYINKIIIKTENSSKSLNKNVKRLINEIIKKHKINEDQYNLIKELLEIICSKVCKDVNPVTHNIKVVFENYNDILNLTEKYYNPLKKYVDKVINHGYHFSSYIKRLIEFSKIEDNPTVEILTILYYVIRNNKLNNFIKYYNSFEKDNTFFSLFLSMEDRDIKDNHIQKMIDNKIKIKELYEKYPNYLNKSMYDNPDCGMFLKYHDILNDIKDHKIIRIINDCLSYNIKYINIEGIEGIIDKITILSEKIDIGMFYKRTIDTFIPEPFSKIFNIIEKKSDILKGIYEKYETDYNKHGKIQEVLDQIIKKLIIAPDNYEELLCSNYIEDFISKDYVSEKYVCESGEERKIRKRIEYPPSL